MTILAQLAEAAAAKAAVELVDRASVASDRWLFLAALALILIGGAAVIWWLVKSLEKKDSMHDASMQLVREAHSKERSEWKDTANEAKAGFLDALKQQRVDFREELALERTATARMAETVQKLAAQLSSPSP